MDPIYSKRATDRQNWLDTGYDVCATKALNQKNWSSYANNMVAVKSSPLSDLGFKVEKSKWWL